MNTSRSTHDNLAWASTQLSAKLLEFKLPPGLWFAAEDAYPYYDFLVCPYSLHACRQDKSKDDFNFFESRCRINVECAFGILVEKWDILRRPMSSTLHYSIKVVSVCMKLHDIGVENSVTRVKPHPRNYRMHDRLLVVPQGNFADNAPRDLKSKTKSTLRDRLFEIVKEGGGVRPAANRSKRARTS